MEPVVSCAPVCTKLDRIPAPTETGIGVWACTDAAQASSPTNSAGTHRLSGNMSMSSPLSSAALEAPAVNIVRGPDP